MSFSSCKALVVIALAFGMLVQVVEAHMRMGYKVTKPYTPRPSRPHKPR